MNYFCKSSKNGKLISKCSTHSLRRFRNYIRTINWENNNLKASLRVNYGKHRDLHGKLSTFINSGVYEDKESFWMAFEAFTEKD